MPWSEFAQFLRRYRITAGLSQEALAERAGVSADAIAALERGRRRSPRPLTVRLLADALELTGDERARFIEAARTPTVAAGGPSRRVPHATRQLVGRHGDLARLRRLLDHDGARLVTVTGPGGVGKSRLVLDLVKTMAEPTGRPVSWVALATASRSVTSEVGAAIGVPLSATARHVDLLADHLDGQAALLVLDDCEHLADPAAALADELISRCPELAVVATSRQPLRAPGEHVARLDPLDEDAAVAMFRERTTAHGLRPTDRELGDVRRLCQLVDGLPLAVELAADRMHILTAGEIADELTRTADILVAGGRAVPPHHRSWHDAMGWSVDLLSPAERDLFAALSVFRGGWTMTAAQAVAVAIPTTAPTRAGQPDVVDLTGRLVDRSLVLARRGDGTTRYDMLRLVREHAATRLTRCRFRTDVERCHLTHMAALAERASRALNGAHATAWMDRLDAELDNIRAAIARAGRLGQLDTARQMVRALHTYCQRRGLDAEWHTWQRDTT